MIQTWTYIMVGLTFALYIGIALATRVRSTSGFYVAGQGVGGLMKTGSVRGYGTVWRAESAAAAACAAPCRGRPYRRSND